MLNREDFCRLLEISSDDLKNRNRRKQLPFGEPERRTRGEYSPYEALLALMVDDLEENGLDRGGAAKIVSNAAQMLVHQAPRLGETSRCRMEGHTTDDILVVEATLALDVGPMRHVLIGTAAEIGARMAQYEAPPLRLFGVNATHALWVLRTRAIREGVELSARLWEDGE